MDKHTPYTAIANDETMVSEFISFVHEALDDGAKKKPDSDERLTGERPYCD